MENTQNLLRWFGSSKVVDKSGNPLIMYHGTDAKFNEFMHDKVGSNYGLDKIGFFFTSDKDSANRSRKSYPNKSKFSFDDSDRVAASSGYVMPVYLKIEHPLYARDIPDFYSTGGGLSSTNLYDANREKVVEFLSSGKYDGFLLKAEGSLLAIVLDPSQVKSVDAVEFSGSSNIYESEFKHFVSQFREIDPILVEGVLAGYELIMEAGMGGSIRLYRGLSSKYDPSYDMNSLDSPPGYSTWTDNHKLAKEYAGTDGYVYQIDLSTPTGIGTSPFTRSGDRVLVYRNQKGCGVNGITGKEYLINENHPRFWREDIKLEPSIS